MGNQNKMLSLADSRSAASSTHGARTRLWRPGQVHTAKEEAVSEASRRWAEFRLAAVGHLAFGDIKRGKVDRELRSLSARQWKHPISGSCVRFGYSTIQRWYYTVLNNPKAPLRALSKRRCDAGVPRIIQQVCHKLTGQAERHPSWTYSRHQQALVGYMNGRDWGPPPSYATVRRYLVSLGTTQNVATNAKIVRLAWLVAHLRRTLIVESTLNRLLRNPELRAKPFGPPFKLSRLFQPREKAYILSRLRDYRGAGGSKSEFCSGVGISTARIERWAASYRRYGEGGLCDRGRRKFPNREKARITKAQILEIFHNQPRTYGINRASWTGKSLAEALYNEFRVRITGGTATRYLRRSGYTMRRARQVLTSSDPDYGAKVEALVQTLRTLGDTEALFFVDELGPLAIKKYGGTSFVERGGELVVPQVQTPKGSIALAAALSATTNQMTWCFTQSKDTTAMIDLIEILFNEHQNKTRIYITWDAASWHDSTTLVDWLDAFNTKTAQAKEGPLIALVPLPRRSQFLNLIEAAFGAMKKAVIHHSDYKSAHQMKSAISQHFRDRNAHFKDNPRRAGKKIWEIDFFRDPRSLPSGNYREY
jgi:transposase